MLYFVCIVELYFYSIIAIYVTFYDHVNHNLCSQLELSKI